MASLPVRATDGLPPIDRHALVTRHNPVLHALDALSPLSVGNGRFCFTADITGLQTFPEAYAAGVPLCTMAEWGWHSFPNPHGWTIDNFPFEDYDSHGRPVPYADVGGRTPGGADPRTAAANSGDARSDYLRDNPHKFNLGQIGLVLTRPDGSRGGLADISDAEQTLDLWDGVLLSSFLWDGQPVSVWTVCAPDGDVLHVRVKSPLLAAGRLAIRLRFPYASPGRDGSDWSHPERHRTTLAQTGPAEALLARSLDGFHYEVAASWSAGCVIARTGAHQFLISPPNGAAMMDFACGFSPKSGAEPPGTPFAPAAQVAANHWNRFWGTGGAVDLSLSRDPRWFELERRIVLSQYLTAIQSAGAYPPAETGLTLNSWNGKFHLEMYWWHEAHFPLWGRASLLERSLGYYRAILPRAKGTAKRQGYDGARWPKMTGPAGAESPSTVGPFLIWQQPHPIYLAELDYRAHPDHATLERFRDVVEQTAAFMASFAWWDPEGKRYVLGPPLQAAQERYPKASMFNPTYELAYWRWGLLTAQRWRERLGLAHNPKWDDVLRHLSALPVAGGKYLFTESATDTYTNPRWATDHPSVVDAYGVLPGPGVDPAIMRRTFDWIWQHWDWSDTWGWDYPALAMCAARLGDPARAIDALLLDTPKNHWTAAGHVFQRLPDLPVYLPANGGLLTAIALMTAGWDGCTKKYPGFPQDGSWTVRAEGLSPLP